jgi:superfamily II DNA/RNA helicase
MGWPSCAIPMVASTDAITERLRQILLKFQDNGVFSKLDFQVLVRHLMLREASRSGGAARLRVPRGDEWPSKSDWIKTEIRTLSLENDEFLLTVSDWHPDWLEGGKFAVFRDAFSDRIVREEGRCKSDPFISEVTGYENYSSPGQREAVRGAFLMRPGNSLIVNLPTGSGKSLAGLAPSLVHKEGGNLSIFVVPTVALAIDQERQMGQYIERTEKKWPLAWYAGLSKSDRSTIWKRAKSGTQRIIFTSPEALVTSLLPLVFDVARAGLLRYLIIDEAHLVTQWGDDFRPGFQALAGLRNSLLRLFPANPVRTLLLSATFTSETLSTLSVLFGPEKNVEIISAVHLRPEPQYWVCQAQSQSQKIERIRDALRHSPRPFILYVNSQNECDDWLKILKDLDGYERIEKFNGSTPDSLRKKLIGSWIQNKIDGMIATSAFGVGIDKEDVRTIIHSGIPETIDRFYQEVGRGGRDGKSSVSLLVFEEQDWKWPKSKSSPKIISNEIGFSRWKSLYESFRDADENGLFSVNLESIRPGLKESNEENVNWNMRTLLLMARAGFIKLELEPVSRSLEAESDFEYSPSSPLSAMADVRVRILRNDHLLLDAWDDSVSACRESTLNAGQKSLQLFEDMLINGREVSDILANLYRIKLANYNIPVTKVCGGCSADRRNEAIGYRVPVALPIRNLEYGHYKSWTDTFHYLDFGCVFVFYEENDADLLKKFIVLTKWLVAYCGVQELSTSKESLVSNEPDWLSLNRFSLAKVLLYRSIEQIEEEPYSPVARMSVIDPSADSNTIQKVVNLTRPFHLIILPLKTKDPNHHSRLLADTSRNSIHLGRIIAAIQK